jgi:hypothetical protein
MDAVSALVAWLVTIVVSSHPPAKMFPNNEQAQIVHIEKLETRAREIIEVVYNEDEGTIVRGPRARATTAAIVMAVAAGESGGFNEAVELGHERGDSGRSWCVMQINIGKGKTPEGWTGKELIEDRKKCFTTGLRHIRRSFGECRSMPMTSRLSAYNTGRCILNEQISVNRIGKALRYVTTSVPIDEVVIEELNRENL